MTTHCSNISRITLEWYAATFADKQSALDAMAELKAEPNARWFAPGCNNRDDTGKCQGHEEASGYYLQNGERYPNWLSADEKAEAHGEAK